MSLDQQAWDLLMEQIRDIKKQNEDQLTLLHQHLNDDAEVKQKVLKHERYFAYAAKASKWAGVTLIGALLTKLGWR